MIVFAPLLWQYVGTYIFCSTVLKNLAQLSCTTEETEKSMKLDIA